MDERTSGGVGGPPDSRTDVIASIEDDTVRRMVGLAVHFRAYAPYYLVTIVLMAVIAFGPRPGGGAGDGLGSTAAATTPGAATGRGSPSADSASGVAAGALSGGEASTLSGAAGAADLAAGALDASAMGYLAGDAGATSGLPEAPAAPDAPSDVDVPETPEDFDYGDTPSACTLSAPSPAPQFAPSKEVAGAQRTVEAAAGLEAPADAAPYVEDGIETVGCPDTGALPDAPPLPIGLPV